MSLRSLVAKKLPKTNLSYTLKSQKNEPLLKCITVHAFGSYVCVHARTIMKIYLLVDRYTNSLSFKCYKSLFIGSGEIGKTNLSMHINHFQMDFLDQFQN